MWECTVCGHGAHIARAKLVAVHLQLDSLEGGGPDVELCEAREAPIHRFVVAEEVVRDGDDLVAVGRDL